MTQMIASSFVLVGIVLGMYACVRLLRNRLKVGAGTVAPEALKIVGKRTLEQRKALYVVEVAGRYLLVGTSESSVNLVDRITAEEFAVMQTPAPEVERSGVTSFATVLAKAKTLREGPARLEKARLEKARLEQSEEKESA